MTIEPAPIGMLVPSSNTALEPEAARLAVRLPGISLHFSRVRVTRVATGTAEDEQFGVAPMAAATALLADAGVRSVAWAGTAGSWLGLEHEADLVAALERTAGAPATTSTLGLLAACRALGARRLGLVTPYTADVVERIRSVYAAEGLTVVAESHLGITDNRAFGDVSAERIASLVREVAAARPDAVLIVCTNLRGTGVVADLEAELGLPVLDSIAVTLWHAADAAGRPFSLEGCGVLLAQGGLRGELVELSGELLAATAADRVTVRLELPSLGLDVEAVAAEAVAAGVTPIGRDRSIRQWELATIQRLQATLEPLAQEHADAEPGIPPALREHYGVNAQLLGPLTQDGELRGWLSVHSGRERGWSAGDLEALGEATRRIAGRLGWQTRLALR